MAAGRLSYTFGMRGPSFPVDTVCSSSLVSLHLSYNSLLLGQCPLVANCGVNLLLTPNTTAMTQKAGMLAADGRCKTLSPAADGYARADTCGVMLLQRLGAVAGSDGALQLAVVRGTAVNQDGRSSSLTAPNGPAQQEVVRAALALGQVPPAAVAGLQMHGTGGPCFLSCNNWLASSISGHACNAHKRCEAAKFTSPLPPCACSPLLQAHPWATPSKWAPRAQSWLSPAPPLQPPWCSWLPSPGLGTLSRGRALWASCTRRRQSHRPLPCPSFTWATSTPT